jgi:hypothetical protein
VEIMPKGKLSISRGHELDDSIQSGPRLKLVPKSEPASAPAPFKAELPPPIPAADYGLVHDRLTALERLARLKAEGALTPKEFAAEKSLVLNLPADELVLTELAPAMPRHSPSLASRMLSWKFLPVGLVAGLALSFGAQPRETMRFFDEALRLFGA